MSMMERLTTGDTEICHVLAARSRVLQAIRGFFLSEGFTEVETPIRIAAPANELHIDAIPSAGRFLRTSPELHMKRLLACGLRQIYQLGPCFRSGENGPRHRPEFTMLEWYRAGADYVDILRDTESLLQHVVLALFGVSTFEWRGREIDAGLPWHVLNVRDVFLEFAGWDPVASYDADRFDLDLVGKVEPALPCDRPVILMDYPAEAAALARCRDGVPPVAERWEMYVAGIELANAYSELVDVGEQQARFAACGAARVAMGKDAYPVDADFMRAMPSLPPSGGIALGVDRLVMLLTNSRDIAQVRPMD